MSTRPQTIQIFLPDGSPSSIREAEITNRLVKVILFPRTALDKVRKREMVHHAGVYFLFGRNEELEKDLVYIGETEDCWNRISSHDRKRDFWTHAAMAVTKTDEFTKTDVKFLEHYCLKIAKETRRYVTENDQDSREPTISESRKYDLLDSFETIKILLATLSYRLFEDLKESASEELEVYYCTSKAASAMMQRTNDGYLVLEGSKAALQESKGVGKWPIRIRSRLKEDKTIVEKGGFLEFSEAYAFSSPSGAAAVVLGRNANGWISWKDKDGKTLDELERKRSDIHQP